VKDELGSNSSRGSKRGTSSLKRQGHVFFCVTSACSSRSSGAVSFSSSVASAASLRVSNVPAYERSPAFQRKLP
jgi:hypothetical protein